LIPWGFDDPGRRNRKTQIPRLRLPQDRSAITKFLKRFARDDTA